MALSERARRRRRYHARPQGSGDRETFEAYTGDDPAGFVFSTNVARWHMTKGQLAIAAVKLKEYFMVKAAERSMANLKRGPERVHGHTRELGRTSDQAAAKFGISGRSVDRVEDVMKKGIPELLDKVASGAHRPYR